MKKILLGLFIFILGSCTSDHGTNRAYVISQQVEEPIVAPE